jgi:iron complex outermembrane receptor protein
METFVVTGSNIPQAADALAIPVAVFETSQMQNSGVNSDTLDLLRKVAPNISGIGQENAQISTGSNFGGASVNIKGLPTLVLIDGRRVATDPAESTGGFQFVDFNMIPTAAIERVEVLQDGASAIYGSDAIGGVINVIMKKNYNGWEIDSHYGFTRDTGHYAERAGSLTGGVSNEKTSIFLSLDYAQHDPIYMSARTYTNPIYGTYTYPGSLEVFNNLTGADNFYQLSSSLKAPPTTTGGYTLQQLLTMGVYTPLTTTQAFHAFNLANGETLSGALKRYTAMANFDHKIFGDNLVAFGSVLAANTKTWSQLNAQPIVPYLQDPWIDVNVMGSSTPPPAGVTYIPVSASTNPFSQSFVDMGQTTPESAPGNGDGGGYEILPRARFIQYPRLYQNDSTLYRVVGGLKGDITPDIHWEGAADLNRYTLAFTNPGLIDTTALQNALASGQLNPFATSQSASAFNGVVGTAFVNMLSTLSSFDFKIDGTPVALPGGKLGFAAGVSYVYEGLSAVPDVNSLPNSTGTTQGWSNATTFQQFGAHRDLDSFFGELSVPITGAAQQIPGAHSINLDAAIRYDSYSGKVGTSTVPQVSLSWAPIDEQFKVRGSAGKSFIAPQLYDLFGPIGAGSTTNITYTPVAGGSKSAQFNETTGANPNLKPTTSKSWTAGFVYTPKAVNGLLISLDYSDIIMKGFIGNVPAQTIIQSVETSGTASPYLADVRFNSAGGSAATGTGQISSHSPQSVYVLENLVNIAGYRVDSTDITVDYTWKTNFGKFDITSTWTWYNRYLEQLIPTEPFYNYVAQASQNNGTVPRWRTYTTLDWNYQGFDAFVGLTYIMNVTDVGVGGDSQSKPVNVASFNSFDLGVTYSFGHPKMNKWLDGLSVTVGCNNIADRQPPLAVNAFPNTNADLGTYDGAIGRMMYFNVKYSF